MTISQRILLHVAGGAALVIAVATAVTYGIVYEAAKQRDLKHLETYVRERTRREEIGFEQVEINLKLVRGQFLKRMDGPLPRNIDGQWNERFERFPDGAWRSRTNFADGRKYSTLWAHKEVVFTPELKTEILRAQNICDELLPGWVDEFPSVYFVLPGWLNIGFDPRIPNWVWDTPADYNATNLEWFALAMPRQPPADRFTWTGVIEESTTKVPIVSAYVPIFQDGKFLGSLGHDKYVNRMMEEITHSDLAGARHVIFRGDGRLVAHPTKLREILESKGQLLMQHCGEPELASLYHEVTGRTEKHFSGFDPASGYYYSVARLAGPDWYFLTTMPRDLLQKQAFQSTQWVLWSGLVSLALVLVFLAVILRRQIAVPLLELTRATKQMSGGDTSASAEVKRGDEFGTLALSFNEMAAKVRERDEALRAEKDGLEARVTERVRTARLNAEVALALNQGGTLAAMLGQCCESLVKHLNAAFARIWILNERTAMLELAASAGLYTRLDGTHSRIPLGELKIGRIAQNKTPHLTNTVATDPRVSDHEWARREGMVAFAGYPLLVEGHVLGVMGLFARHPLNEETLDAMAQVADSVALGVQRKATEARLLESETRFSAAFRQSPAMQSLIRASDRVLIEVNDTFLNKLGFTREQVVGKTASELKFWADPEELTGFAREIESKGFVLSREVRLRTTNGHVLTVLLSSQPVDIAGVPHLLSAGVDITARKEAEAKLIASERQLRESEARFNKAFQTNPVLMTIARLDDSKFVEVNPAFLKHIGVDRTEIIGRNSKELGLWVDLNAREDFFRRLRRDRLVRDAECQIRTRAGTIHTMQISGELIELNGEPHLITFALDVTQTKRAEAELQNALAKERELSQLKSDFVSLVSHEFRTPLEIIMSSVDNLDRYHERLPVEKRQQLLGSINKAVRRMAGMMEEVLVLGRLETDRVTFQPAPLDLSALGRRISDEIESATGKRCLIDFQLMGDAHGAVGDESLLRHIFTNLLSNSVKYSVTGQRVDFAVKREGHQAVCSIIDRGCGIPEPDQKRLFQAFHRGSNVEQIPGTGLGLLIVQRCVELHGGGISFTSVEGQGTTFTVTLPLFGKNSATNPAT